MNNINLIKTTVFVSLVIILIGLEFFFPKKKRVYPRLIRWISNTLIILVNRVLTPLFVLVPIFSLSPPFRGLLQIVDIPYFPRFILGFLIMDLVIYIQHRLFHVLPVLWDIHRMHHTDRDLDFTSALRFHPFELFISMVVKLMAVWIFGIDAKTFIIFEICINSFAMFNHGNFSVPYKVEKILRIFIITPDIHRIHHSVLLNECNSNYGTIFTVWDYLFKSLVLIPKKGQDGMVIGLPGYKDKKYQYFHWMLITPFLIKRYNNV